MIPDDPEIHLAENLRTLAPSLAPLERTVVALAMRDPLWSVPRPRRLFALKQPEGGHLQLANPRLERLRRFVVLLCHGQSIDAETETKLTAGFSLGQIQEARLMSGLAGRA